MFHRISPSKLSNKAAANLFLSLIAVLILFAGTAAVSYLNTRTLNRDADSVTHTHEVLSSLDDLVSLMKDAETGQRGYLITGTESYLEPHTAAVLGLEKHFSDLAFLTRDNPLQQARLPALKKAVDVKLIELAETIALRKNEGFESAKAVVTTDRGKQSMDAIRSQINVMEEEENILRRSRLAEMESAYQISVVSVILAGIFGALLAAVAFYLVRRTLLARVRQDWLQAGRLGLSETMINDQRVEELGESVITFLAEYLDAHVGAFFVADGDIYRRIATYGVPDGKAIPFEITSGQGLLGQAIKDGKSFVVNDVPDGYLTIGSALGRASPRHLLVVPMKEDGRVNAVLELGFVHKLEEASSELFEVVCDAVGTAVRAANYRTHLQNLLEETQRQSEELQAQSEELRVSNEELEEQSRALKESQARLELQQVELEQNNAQLEEQTQLLEAQKDDVTRSKNELQVKAKELEQASQYKSDFLANMSHELRTPLNSSLILSKLLADNRDGNLSNEQIRYAETIYAAGNDLLALINDILDLSKIEAGHMQMRPEHILLSELKDDLARVFDPVAAQKKVGFEIILNDSCPVGFESDRQRFEQILKNLLSNALKFTEAGQVSLSVNCFGDKLAFAVKDTGIGIPEHQQRMVFEAFRQADGTTNRKYGGTGLGLSIARELARLLGAEVSLVSEVGVGSTFTVLVPQKYNPDAIQPPSSDRMRETTKDLSVLLDKAVNTHMTRASNSSASIMSRVQDDRQKLTPDKRIILVVEDDQTFSRIIFDLAHEMDFYCLLAGTAEEGLAMAVQHRPSAVVLDVGLPDNSGLSVLDRLKQDSRTRHIPVHVVSAHDYSQTAMSLGAVGYILKPVRREQLVKAFQQLETRLDQRLRRVLIVEDDPVQRDSVQQLLAVHDVETVGAESVAECLEKLKSSTFDCMVLDLSLPDASGYTLLETLSREDAYSFPPVIVYTGRELSEEEESRLRKYSKSIIIKGVKSPERLLDEVTLFLHQVVTDLPVKQQKMIEKSRSRDAALEGRRVLVVEDDVRNIFAITSILEPRGANLQIARNGKEALAALERSQAHPGQAIDLVLMDIMMPEMDGITATREIRKRDEWKNLPIIALTAKAMRDDQEQCLAAGANDYMAKPLDVEKLLSLVRVWIRR